MDPKNTDTNIHFREGVDARLQYICGANYSLFVHLALANEIIKNWNDTSLDAVYARLASAFDVFEVLVIQFHFLICECRAIKSELVDGLSQEAFLKLAEEYYKSEYAKLRQFYISVGKKVPPISIPTKAALFGEFFKGHGSLKTYLTMSGQLRALRNAIVHDVRVGMLLNEAGELLIPKPSVVSNYRQWSKVQEVAGDAARMARDFCEVKTQCKSDILRAMQVINELYGFILEQFQEEFYSKDRSTLRDVFGIQFQDKPSAPLIIAEQIEAHDSSSFKIYNPSNNPIPLSGVYTPPPELRE